ncbi:urease accessory protein UreF, putative [Medicago truncatula]|uniref:Urease accessory protein UreF, putative n=1 Tax=Medicago truncatula TaxID=3880 RepID=A0A072UR87_MEDTR|nr:urease accessory protein UreF, putative [Medicago truncatula]
MRDSSLKTFGAALLQYQVAPIAEVILEKWMNRDVEEACQTMPLLDTVQVAMLWIVIYKKVG